MLDQRGPDIDRAREDPGAAVVELVRVGQRDAPAGPAPPLQGCSGAGVGRLGSHRISLTRRFAVVVLPGPGSGPAGHLLTEADNMAADTGSCWFSGRKFLSSGSKPEGLVDVAAAGGIQERGHQRRDGG